MKRILSLVVILSVLVLAIAISVPALADSRGAVKTDMVVHDQVIKNVSNEDVAGLPAGTVVGSVILNTTAKGYLIVVVNLDDAVEGVYDSLVHINGTKILDQVAVDCLKVNKKGQGTANYKVDLGALPAGLVADGDAEIEAKVVVRPSFSPNTLPCYVNGPAWPTEITVPLK